MGRLLGTTRLKILVVGTVAEMTPAPEAMRAQMSHNGETVTVPKDNRHVTFEEFLNNDGEYFAYPIDREISRDRSAAMEDQQMHRPPTPAFAQAVRQVLGIDDLIPRPGVVIPALRDPVTGPKIEAAHQAILASRLEARQRATGPLPWLPPVPHQLTEDDFWGRYFDRRHELIQRQGSARASGRTRSRQKVSPVSQTGPTTS